jgi:hypothetical protein
MRKSAFLACGLLLWSAAGLSAERVGSPLWNQLNTALFARTAADGATYGLDGLDILYWPGTRHLLTEPSHSAAIRALDRFINEHGELPLPDPLERALLQRSLWQLFDWTAVPGQPDLAVQRTELRNRLAVVIQRLALTSEELRALPDNYANAEKSASLSDLPTGLLNPASDWLTVGATAGVEPVALSHVAAPSFGGRSVFLVMVRLPQGRSQGLEYLRTLHDFEGPLIYASRPISAQHTLTLSLNPAVPQFPAGTDWALVRRMCVIDDRGRIQPTPVVESIQVRRYLSVPAITRDPRALDGFLHDEAALPAQRFMEFEMEPRHSAVLRAVADGERDFPSFFNSGVDPFDEKQKDLSVFQPETLRM